MSVNVSDKIKWNNSFESRHSGYTSSENVFKYRYILSDFSSLISVKIRTGQTVNLGYLIRFRDSKIYHRTIQQYNFIQNANARRIGHRVALDQTFADRELPEFRIRYRVVFEIPLSGDKVDPTEFYLKMGNEYILAFQEESSDPEIRLIPLLGYEFSRKNKLEAGLDYRLSGLSRSEEKQHRLWLSLT